MFRRFKRLQELRRVAEMADELANRIPTQALKLAFPELDPTDVRNRLARAAFVTRAIRRAT